MPQAHPELAYRAPSRPLSSADHTLVRDQGGHPGEALQISQMT
jgi:hypothetical protein